MPMSVDENNFSFVTYKSKPTVFDYVDVKHWVENHLRMLATKKNMNDVRNNVDVEYFKKIYSEHIKMVRLLNAKIKSQSLTKKQANRREINRRYYEKRKINNNFKTK